MAGGPLVLAGDVGGTHTRLALVAVERGQLRVVTSRAEHSAAATGLEPLAVAFLEATGGRPEAACVGVAGPVLEGRVQGTNLPWGVDAAVLGAAIGVARTWLLNDLEATAYGLAALGPDEVETLAAGDPDPRGDQAVVAAGTGLGEAGLIRDGGLVRPFATEGGHADFAPVDDLQIELLRFLCAEFGRVSVERVLSGPGLLNLYRFLRDTGREPEPGWLAAEMAEGDAPAVIAGAAMAGRSALAERALDLFVAIYGAEAGNVALRLMATGGVYLGGGIAPRILPWLRRPVFLERFAAKGRLHSLLERIPVHVVLREDTALIGAARAGALRAGLL